MSVDTISGSSTQSMDVLVRGQQTMRAEPRAEPAQPVSFEANDRVLISGDDLRAAIEQLNMQMQKMNRNVNFSVDGVSGKDVVRVTDSNTGQVVRQLPSEDMLQFIRNLENMVGVIFDSRT